MATLILIVLYGLFIAYFATQNTGPISLHFLNYTASGVPAYIAIVGALLVGLFLSWIISLANSISTGFTIRGKENKLKEAKKEAADLTKRLHELELENERLKAENHQSNKDDKSL
ncbi:MAG: lipopolysaccharide assembly protein LapA domain-containing protein [Patescibacteria group bacterium]|nr:lipopolysaccharide assembly protein LapA domain-containing protein [Patescibacteria group bacterium]